jgi:undecaprenyl-diphosphatase
LLRG